MNKTEQLHALEEDLTTMMTQEIHTLRELLANLQREQNSLIANDQISMQSILNTRVPLIDAMHSWHEKMIANIHNIGDILNITISNHDELSLKEWLGIIIDLVGHENMEILTLRDQILALVDRIDKQNSRNHFLLEHKLSDNASTHLQKMPESKKHLIQTQTLSEDEEELS